MRTVQFVISLVIAGAIVVTTSVWVGLVLAVECALFQALKSWGRNANFKSAAAALTYDFIKSGMFLIPLGLAGLSGAWLAGGGVVVAYLLNLFTDVA